MPFSCYYLEMTKIVIYKKGEKNTVNSILNLIPLSSSIVANSTHHSCPPCYARYNILIIVMSWNKDLVAPQTKRRIGGADGNKGNKGKMAEDDTQGARRRRCPNRGLSSVVANDNNTNDKTNATAFRALVDQNDQMGKEMEYLRNRLNQLEKQQQQQQQQQQLQQQQQQPPQERPSHGTTADSDADADSSAAVDGGGDNIDTTNKNAAMPPSNKRVVKWRDPNMDKLDNGSGKRNDC